MKPSKRCLLKQELTVLKNNFSVPNIHSAIMLENYPTYKYTEDDVNHQLARLVRLDNPDSYPFDLYHSHEYNEILVFIKGGGQHNINFKRHVIEDNSIHLLAANEMHWIERAMTSTGFAIVYKEQFLHKLQLVNPEIDFQLRFNHSQIINLSKKEAEDFNFIFYELLNNVSPSAYQLQIIGAFLAKIADLLQPITNLRKTQDAILSQLLPLIEENFKRLKTTAHYAALLHLSERTLYNRVKKASGCTVMELVLERTLKEAKKFLSSAAYTVAEIADELGFKEPSHFSHWFKKQTGMLPSAYKYGK